MGAVASRGKAHGPAIHRQAFVIADRISRGIYGEALRTQEVDDILWTPLDRYAAGLQIKSYLLHLSAAVRAE